MKFLQSVHHFEGKYSHLNIVNIFSGENLPNFDIYSVKECQFRSKVPQRVPVAERFSIKIRSILLSTSFKIEL